MIIGTEQTPSKDLLLCRVRWKKQKSNIYNLQVVDKIEYSQTSKIDLKTNEHKFHIFTLDAIIVLQQLKNIFF